MKNILLSLISFSLIILTPIGELITNDYVKPSRYAKDHIIVKLKTYNITSAGNKSANTRSIQINTIKHIAEQRKIKLRSIKSVFPAPLIENNPESNYEFQNYYKVYITDTKDIRELCKTFEENSLIDFAEPDYIGEAAGFSNIKISTKPNDEYFSRQWGLHNDGSHKPTNERYGKAGADMNVLKGWEIETGNSEVIVAILDSGVKFDHPDLKGRIWINTKETKNGRDDDANGYIDDIYGWNFAYENSNVRDDGGHGTNICGTIGASTNNKIGYAGIDQNCKLMICKNLDEDNTGEYSWWSESIYYAAKNGAQIINMSEGGYDYSKTLATAVKYATDRGCLIVASMMNKNNGDDYYPAALPNVMAIGATDTDDSRCKQFTWGGGSNWGNHISLVAPGNKIYGLDYQDSDNYDVYWSGTSQATAYVSGIAALLLAQDRTRNNNTLREIITSTAKDQTGDTREDKKGWDKYYGYGRVDLYASLTNDISKIDKRVYDDSKNNNDREDDINYDNANKGKPQPNDPKTPYEENNDDSKKAKRSNQ